MSNIFHFHCYEGGQIGGSEGKSEGKGGGGRGGKMQGSGGSANKGRQEKGRRDEKLKFKDRRGGHPKGRGGGQDSRAGHQSDRGWKKGQLLKQQKPYEQKNKRNGTPPAGKSPPSAPLVSPVVVNMKKFKAFVMKQAEDTFCSWEKLGYIPPGQYREFLAGFEGPMIPFIEEKAGN